MTTYGVTPQGFVAKTLDDVSQELTADLQAAFGQNIYTDAKSLFGQYIGIMAERFGEMWNLGQDIYNSFDADGALGVGLDNVCSITGTARLLARPSTVVLTLTGTPGTIVPGGRSAQAVNNGPTFSLNASVTLAFVAAFVNGMTANLFQRVTAGGNIYQCIQAGVAGSTPPSGTTGIITTGGTEEWVWLGTGTAAGDIAGTCTVNGPNPAHAGTITSIATPVSGWQSVTNVFDALLGALIEDDPTLRVRREVELFGNAAATLNAIRERILNVDEGTNTPVTACAVFQNVTMTTDANGLPPKSVEVVAIGGVDQHIANEVFASVAAGIETYGTTTMTVVDQLGNNQSVSFARPTPKYIYVTVNVEVDSLLFDAVNGPTAILDNIVTWALGYYTMGKGVASSAVAAQVWRTLGVINVPLPFVGLAPSPGSSATVPCAPRDQALFDSSRVVVNVITGSEGSP